MCLTSKKTPLVRFWFQTACIQTPKFGLRLCREKCGDDEVLNDAEAAYALVEGITQGRNDFVHAVFAIATGTSWMLAEYKPGKEPRPKRNQAVALYASNARTRASPS